MASLYYGPIQLRIAFGSLTAHGAMLCVLFGWFLVVTPLVYHYVVVPCGTCSHFGAVMAHEMGHALGIGHSDGAAPQYSYRDNETAHVACESEANGTVRSPDLVGSRLQKEMPLEGSLMATLDGGKFMPCISADDLAGLNWLYPCGGRSTPMCPGLGPSEGRAWRRLWMLLSLPLLGSGVVLGVISLVDSFFKKEETRNQGIIKDLVERLGASMQLDDSRYGGDLSFVAAIPRKGDMEHRAEQALGTVEEEDGRGPWAVGDREGLHRAMILLGLGEEEQGADLLFRSYDMENEGWLKREKMIQILQNLLEQKWRRDQLAVAREVAVNGELVLPVSGIHLGASDASIVRDAYQVLRQDIYGGEVTRKALRQRVELYGESAFADEVVSHVLFGDEGDVVGIEHFAEVYVELTKLARQRAGHTDLGGQESHGLSSVHPEELAPSSRHGWLTDSPKSTAVEPFDSSTWHQSERNSERRPEHAY